MSNVTHIDHFATYMLPDDFLSALSEADDSKKASLFDSFFTACEFHKNSPIIFFTAAVDDAGIVQDSVIRDDPEVVFSKCYDMLEQGFPYRVFVCQQFDPTKKNARKGKLKRSRHAM